MFHSFDQEVQSAMSVGHCLTKEYSDLLTELQGQLFFLSGNLLLKRAQKVCCLEFIIDNGMFDVFTMGSKYYLLQISFLHLYNVLWITFFELIFRTH